MDAIAWKKSFGLYVGGNISLHWLYIVSKLMYIGTLFQNNGQHKLVMTNKLGDYKAN